MLINGVEIHNYKSKDKVYYGPLKSVDVLFGGNDYDVINKPNIKISSGSAKIQPVLSGSVKDVYVDEQEFDIDSIISIGVTGGNGFGAVLNPVLKRRARQVFFDARVNTKGLSLIHI